MVFLAGWIFVFAYLGGILALLCVFLGWIGKQVSALINSVPKAKPTRTYRPISKTPIKPTPKPVTPKDHGFIL